MNQLAAFSLLLGLSVAHAGTGPLLVPTSQTRSISGTAYAADKFGGPLSDSDSEQASDFGPFQGAASAGASVDSAIGSGGGQQSSTILGNRITAVGGMFATAETWDFGATAEGTATNRLTVTFDVTAATSYELQGQIAAFDEGLAEVSLREGGQEIFGVVIFGPATTLPIARSGTLQPGPHTLEIRLEASVFGSDFFPAYSSGDFDIELLLGASGPGGEVPDDDDVPGPPLLLDKLAGAQVRLNWSPSCRTADNDFAIYEGEIADPSALAPATCSTAGAKHWDLSPAHDASFFIVVPRAGASEGSYGDDGHGDERQPSLLACQPQALGAPVCP